MTEFDAIVSGSAARTDALKAAREVLVVPAGLFGVTAGAAPTVVDLVSVAEYIMHGIAPRRRPIAHRAPRTPRAKRVLTAKEKRLNNTVGRISFAGVLALIFITLKLVGVIAWSWWWVLAPLWLPVAIGLVIVVLTLIGLVVGKARGNAVAKKSEGALNG